MPKVVDTSENPSVHGGVAEKRKTDTPQGILHRLLEAKKRSHRNREARTESVVDLLNEIIPLLLDAENIQTEHARTDLESLFNQARITPEERILLVEQFKPLVANLEHLADRIVPLIGEYEKKEHEEKITLAIFNQQLTDFLVHSSYNSEQQSQAILFIHVLEMVLSRSTRFKEEVEKYLRGIKAQVAVTQALSKAGFIVLLPDWEKPEETDTLDARGSIDLIVINNEGKILFIDVIGGGFPEVGSQDTSPLEEDRAKEVRQANFARLQRGEQPLPVPVPRNEVTYEPVHQEAREILKSYLKTQIRAKSPNQAIYRKAIERIEKTGLIRKSAWKVFTVPNEGNRLTHTGSFSRENDKKGVVEEALSEFGHLR